MKKLLIIQQDEAYFLFETIQVLEKHQHALKDFDCTILVDANALTKVFDQSIPLLKGLTTDSQKAIKQHYDISVNLSMLESSWDFHGEINSSHKIGPHKKDGQLLVADLWSSFLLTLKAKAPFLTFHLQDLYKNILGLKGLTPTRELKSNFTQIAFGMLNTDVFPASEQETFIHEIHKSFPHLAIKDLSEIDLISDVSHTLYIGPAHLEALKFCEAGGKGIFLTRDFQGFNLLPYNGGHLFISSKSGIFESQKLISIIEREILNKSPSLDAHYPLYRIEHENIFGAYLKSLNSSDDHYPFYQSHVVLWNFLLNLFDVNLEITKCTAGQVNFLKDHHFVLAKFLRLHDYAMVSMDTIYQQVKLKTADAETIEGHIKNLQEIDRISDQISVSHSMLRPILDFYRIRRGQNTSDSLYEQVQASYLTYTEEHQALTALHELFSVTLRRNEVNI